MPPKQGLLPGMPPPADDDVLAGAKDPAEELRLSIERLAEIHRRQDALAGVHPS